MVIVGDEGVAVKQMASGVVSQFARTAGILAGKNAGGTGKRPFQSTGTDVAQFAQNTFDARAGTIYRLFHRGGFPTGCRRDLYCGFNTQRR